MHEGVEEVIPQELTYSDAGFFLSNLLGNSHVLMLKSWRRLAPQFTGMKRPSLRRLACQMARARSSLPVPDSPKMRTGMSLGAARRAMAVNEFYSSDENHASYIGGVFGYSFRIRSL